jgi:hypothetical protein
MKKKKKMARQQFVEAMGTFLMSDHLYSHKIAIFERKLQKNV